MGNGINKENKSEEKAMRRLLFIFLLFMGLSAAKEQVIILEVQHEEVDLLRYYRHDNKELNLSNVQIGDEALNNLEEQLKVFIESVGVERLIIENADLKTVPFNIIGFTLISQTLKYVSFLGNKFYDSSFSNVSTTEEVRPRMDSLVAGSISSLWGNLSPEIERILKEHNSNGSKFHYYNKIIFIDRTMPPITILDSKRAPYSKTERIKYIMVRVGLFGLGVIVTLAPSIIPWLLSTDKGSE